MTDAQGAPDLGNTVCEKFVWGDFESFEYLGRVKEGSELEIR